MSEQKKAMCPQGHEMKIVAPKSPDNFGVFIAGYVCDCGWQSPRERNNDREKAIEAAYLAATKRPPVKLERMDEALKREGFTDLEEMIAKYKTTMLVANEIDIEKDEEIERLKAQIATITKRPPNRPLTLHEMVLMNDAQPVWCVDSFNNVEVWNASNWIGENGMSDRYKNPVFFAAKPTAADIEAARKEHGV